MSVAMKVNLTKNNGYFLSNKLILEHQLTVKKIAYKLLNRLPSSIQIEDLIQEGMIGLMEASIKYKPNSEASFKTFAGIRIYGSMIDYLRSNSWVPRSVSKFSREYKESMNELSLKLNREPKDQELIDFMNISNQDFYKNKNDIEKSQIANINEFNENEVNNVPSLEMSRDAISNQFRNTPDGETVKSKFYKSLVREIENLNDEHQIIMSLYYNDEVSLKEIGVILGKSEGRISQIIKQCVETLKLNLKDWK
jgi:RNA polymerase sigma factor for flagellar operon FliA